MTKYRVFYLPHIWARTVRIFQSGPNPFVKLRAREVRIVQNLGSNRSSHGRILILDQDNHIEVDGFVIMVRPTDGADH